jgi:hypothetical protein
MQEFWARHRSGATFRGKTCIDGCIVEGGARLC